MKKVTALLLGLVCLFFAMGVAAADEENIEVSEEDVQMIVTYISGLPNKEFDGLASYDDSDILIGSIKLVNKAKNAIVTQYRESGSYEGLKSEDWQYIVPVADGDSGFVCVFTLLKNQDGVEYAASLKGNQTDIAISKYLVNCEQIEIILQENGINEQDVQRETYLMSYMYRTLFYAFTTADGEFMIPFSDLWIGDREYVFESGRIYPIRDVMNTLETLGLELLPGEESPYGGNRGFILGTVKKDQDGKNLYSRGGFWAVVAGVVFCLGIGIAVFVKGRKKRKK